VESNTGPAPGLPATGLRVLDLTRVIAGPLAGRTLAAWGAQVLRIDPPHRPELSWQHAEMDAGKLSAVLDVGTADGAAAVRALAADADVVLLGYRPGALARHGLAADDLLADAGHLVVVELSAWGWTGPWSSRRGFDSIVQAASGIAAGCAAQDGTPGALPAQVLDHATGFLAAGAALDAVRRRPESGGTRIRLALATTAEWLRRLSSGGTADAPAELDPAPFLRQDGGHRWVAPPFAVGGVALEFPFPARPYGADQPVWPSQDGASTGIRGSGEATRPNRSVPAAQSR
jgi:crotonobetainyl-CoA:carnitine CoA-transferase CaiB-like acyl-CoA transferase